MGILLLAAVLYAGLLRWPLLSLDGEPGSVASHDEATGVRLLTPPKWLLPVDDPYIFIRHAQQISRGRFYQWTDGEFSTGASSLVYPWLLLPGQWLFDDVGGWSRWSSWVGTLALWVLGLAAARMLRVAGLPRPWPLVGGLCLVFSGPIAWVSVGGMDSALGCAALLWACSLWAEIRERDMGASRDRRKVVGLLVLIALLPWIRPDFALVTGLASLAVLLGKGPAVPRWCGPLLLVPGLLWATTNLLLTGHASPAGVLAKSALSSPFVSLERGLEILGSLVSNNLLPLYAGLRPTILPPPVGWMALVMAVAVLLAFRKQRALDGESSAASETVTTRRALLPVVVAWACSVISTGFSGYMAWQKFRHHHPGLACAWLLALAGTYLLIRRWQPRWSSADDPSAIARKRRLGSLLLLCLPLLLLSRVSDWSYDYFQSTVQFYQDNGVTAEWLAKNQRNAVLLVHDAGLLVLAHDGPSVDMMGLGTTSFALPYRDGSGAVVETLARHQPRPEIVAGTDRLLRIPGLLGPPLFVAPSRAYLPDGMLIAPLLHERLETTALEGDGIDFAHVDDEKKHTLKWDPPPRPLQASFAFVHRGPRGRPEMQGCRPLKSTLAIEIPQGVQQLRLRWAPQPGHGGSLEIRSGVEAAGPILAKGSLEAGSRAWGEIPIVLDGDSWIRIENVGNGEPCLESVGFLPPCEALAPSCESLHLACSVRLHSSTLAEILGEGPRFSPNFPQPGL